MKKIKNWWKNIKAVWFAMAASTDEMEQYYMREDLERQLHDKGF